LGYDLPEEEALKAFERFKDLADKKKEVTDEDIEAILGEQVVNIPKVIELEYFLVSCGNQSIATSTVRVKKEGKVIEEASTGDGPIDATYKAIDRACGINCKLMDYSIKAVSGGKDAMGEVVVKVERNGKIFTGRGLSTDIIEASALAYVNALNKSFATNGGVISN
jgi:2-isopropylmalate synthase